MAPSSKGAGDGITLMVISGRGVWTVGRRSSVLCLWDQKTGQYKGSYDVTEVVHGADPDITALAVRGGAIWLGTRSGYLLVLDSSLMEEGRAPLLGLQQCGTGKVKCIVPIVNATAKVQVLCSLEFPDEVSCHLLTWEYFHTSGHRSSNCTSTLPSHTPPVHKPSL